MFDEFVLKRWKLTHFKIGAWYHECSQNVCPPDEAALFPRTDVLTINDLLFEILQKLEEELDIAAGRAHGSHEDVAIAITHIFVGTSKSSRRGLKKT